MLDKSLQELKKVLISNTSVFVTLFADVNSVASKQPMTIINVIYGDSKLRLKNLRFAVDGAETEQLYLLYSGQN